MDFWFTLAINGGEFQDQFNHQKAETSDMIPIEIEFYDSPIFNQTLDTIAAKLDKVEKLYSASTIRFVRGKKRLLSLRSMKVM